MQSPYPPLFGCVNKAGSLPLGRVMLSHALKRYYEPLRLPIQPAAISFPYTHRLMVLSHHHTGSPALGCLSSASCRPCYPGRSHRSIPFSKPVRSGLPHLTTGSASPVQVTRLHLGSLSLQPDALPFGNLRPSVSQTPLPSTTGAHGQFPGRDSNPLDKQLLLRTVRSCINIICTRMCECKT